MTKYTITKRGRWGYIFPIPEGKLASALNMKMQYTKKGLEYFPNPLWGIVKLYKKDKGVFPWGFKELVIEVFNQWKEYSLEDDFEIVTYEKFQDNVIFYDNDLRYYQKEAVQALMKNNGGIICLPTGAGKSRLTIEFIKQLNVNALVVVHTTDLRGQWNAILPEGSKAVTYQSIKDIGSLKDFKLVIQDECHHVSAKSLYKVAMHCSSATLVGLCLERNTGIVMGDGSHNYIINVKEGEEVLSYNHEKNIFEPKKVLRVFRKKIDYYYEIRVKRRDGRKESVIRCSGNHKFFTNNGYIEANLLHEGDKVKVYSDSPYKFFKGAWNKGTKGILKSHRKGLTMEQEYGKEVADNMKQSISMKLMGHKMSQDTVIKRSNTIKEKGCFKGEKNPMYTTGIMYMNRRMKKKSDNKCEICNILESRYKRLHVHHKDKDRTNNEEFNLITVCSKCHSKIHGGYIQCP